MTQFNRALQFPKPISLNHLNHFCSQRTHLENVGPPKTRRAPVRFRELGTAKLETMKKKKQLRFKVDIENGAEEFSCWQQNGGNLIDKLSCVEEPVACSICYACTIDRSGISASRGNNIGWQLYKNPRLECIRFRSIFIPLKALPPLNPTVGLYRCYHFGTKPSSSLVQNVAQNNVAIFWDLDNKPPKSVSPFDAAIRLKNTATSFGFVKYMVAYANHHAFNYVPVEIREQRKERKALNQLENMGVLKPVEPYFCRVCGRRFYNNEKLVNHFKQIHEREQKKRLNQIESARGSRRVKLVEKFSMKMNKYKNAARDVLTPKVGYGLADELKRAGFWVRTVSDKPQAADIALRNHMVNMMDKRRVECVILLSDDSDFVEVLKEARLRCLKTVVVGDSSDGALKRTADAAFSWQEIMSGKAKREAASVVGQWKDSDVLKSLDWTYNPETVRKNCCACGEVESEYSDSEGFLYGEDDSVQNGVTKAWWGTYVKSSNN